MIPRPLATFACQQTSLFEHIHINDMGSGAIARCDIQYGTLILEEEPILRINREDYRSNSEMQKNITQNIIREQFDRLSEQDQDIVESMCDHKRLHSGFPKTLDGIFSTNCMQGDGEEVVLCRQYPLLNHSCRNNVEMEWNDSGNLRLYACKDIKKGEQLCNRYMECMATYEERQRLLKGTWKFECRCELCSAPLAERAASDKRRIRFHQLLSQAEENTTDTREQCEAQLKTFIELLDLVKQEHAPHGIPSENAMFAFAAYQHALALQDIPEAQKFIDVAYKNTVLSFGENDSRANALLNYVNNITSHEAHRWLDSD